MWKRVLVVGMVFASLLVFSTCASVTVSYEHTYSDPTGDVSPNSNSNIDITTVGSAESGANIVLTMVVAGTIDATTSSYTISVTVDGVSGYYFSYSYGYASGYDSNYNTIPVESDASGNTLTFTVAKTDLDATTSFDIYYASTYDSASNFDWCYASTDGGDGDGGEETADPCTETPTDTSISVAMSIDFDYQEGTTTVLLDWKMSGTTSGVDHCSFCTVTQYANGTKEVSAWADGPIPETTYGDMTIKFVNTSDSWQTWEFRFNGTVNKTEIGWKEGEKPTKMIVYVRAYSDSAEEHWNQASKEVTFSSTGPVVTDGSGGGDSGKKGFIPGFEVLAALVAIGISSLIFTRRKK